MLKEKKLNELQRLISKGRAKGYLTYDEVNNAFGSEADTDHMDDMIMVLDEMDIELVDDETKLKLKARAGTEEDEEDADADKGEGVSLATEDGRVSDPVKMYLREMGLVSLLTREGEVKIAKRIEKGERQIISALLESSLCAQEILSLGEALEQGTIRIRDVVRDIDEEESLTNQEKRKKDFLTLVEKVLII